ncbi:uncharacterized protein PFLUO_LOCUS3185 [Penicillium psychrofluorescens]|uniref:uncharacterized protein n=1 Tax=Penicillium psychrofluorescens TaxID=3158075 RepID=UPI003CCD8EFD
MKVISLLPLFSAATLAHPSGLWWGTDQCYSIPANTDNYCLEGQKAGFDWSDLANGDNWSPEGFNFIGFSPKSNCQAAGTGNCIGGKLSRNDNWTLRVDAEAAPFSVRDFHLATSRTTDVLITYSLADGSFCHQVATSSPEGLDIHNDQCGGATSVEFRLPEESAFGECDMDIHRIHFDCSTGPKPPPTPSTFSLGYPKPSTTTVVEVHTFTFTKTPVLTTSTVWTTAEVTITECPPAVTDCPPHSTVILTSTYSLSTTVCSATVTAPGPDHTIPPVNVQSSTVTRTITVMPNTVETPPAVSLSSCPDVVPKCMNTWLTIPKCDSNSDTGCFCPSTMFTEKVTSCIKAWGSSQEEIRSGLSYFAGICAPYVPSNPTIIDHVPPPPPVDIPCTTITWSSETVTVPVVSFSTITIHSTTTHELHHPVDNLYFFDDLHHSFDDSHHSVDDSHHSVNNLHFFDNPHHSFDDSHHSVNNLHFFDNPHHSFDEPHHPVNNLHFFDNPHHSFDDPHHSVNNLHFFDAPHHSFDDHHNDLYK